MLGNKPNQPTKFTPKNWVEINNDACGTYNINSLIKFKTSMLTSSLRDYSDAYILVKGTITVTAVPPPAANPNNNDKEVVFKNCAPFTICISEVNNTQIDNAKYIDVTILMYNLGESSDDYSKTSGSLWEPALADADAIANFHLASNSVSFKFKQKITGKTADGGTNDVEIMVLLKYLTNFCRTLEMLLINCEINLILT